STGANNGVEQVHMSAGLLLIDGDKLARARDLLLVDDVFPSGTRSILPDAPHLRPVQLRGAAADRAGRRQPYESCERSQFDTTSRVHVQCAGERKLSVV